MNLPKGWEEVEHTCFTMLLSLLVFSGWATLSSRRRIGVVAGVLAAAMLFIRWFNHWSGSEASSLIEVIVSLLFYAYFAYVLMLSVFDRREVDRYKLEGAIVVYLLLAVVFAQMYTLVELLDPGSFSFTRPYANFANLRKELVYYSFSTLTTLGLGDIAPVGPTARSLTAIQACIGVLFPNILIARLVSLEIVHSSHRAAK